MHFHGSKLKSLKALVSRSSHETEAPIAFFLRLFVEGRIGQVNIKIKAIEGYQLSFEIIH